ncbi:piggyBac transposable element-derived 3-like [Brachionus plicatilis]|uniref:PiggyBac transposable element-derived 3-like n=1 Tax=Brachionus plicatilis TaxID=10195 RepID=A0A3M7P9L7_BRAPC|nr:piggyBac transposable element-derived 3-like [Brachionus plicatilis]
MIASALRALNLLVNANDAESGGSDESDVDFDLEDLDSEDEYLVSDYSSDDECESEFDEPIECSSDQQPPSGQSRNLDKTSKAGVHWTKLDDGDETGIRKRIVFNEKSGPTSFAASRIDSTALSAFLVIFDLSMVEMVLDCTNAFAESVDPQLSFKKEEILAFIGLLLSRGVFCHVWGNLLFLGFKSLPLHKFMSSAPHFLSVNSKVLRRGFVSLKINSISG